jgi:hypothetical protein
MAKKKSSGGLAPEKLGDAEVKPEGKEEEGVSSGDFVAEGGDGTEGAALTFADRFVTSPEPESEELDGEVVMVTCLRPSRLIVKNAPSGTLYVWPEAGSTIAVKIEDIPFLAEKNHKAHACCGSSGERRYFDI